jgi:hypothetical protein
MRKKTVVLLAFGIVAALMLSPVLVEAAVNTQQQLGDTYEKPGSARHNGRAPLWSRVRQRIQAFASQSNNSVCLKLRNGMRSGLGVPQLEGFEELPDLDEDDVKELIDAYKGLLEFEESQAKPLWILIARGRSWSIDVGTETADIAPEECAPIGMRLAIRPVKAKDGTIVFRVVRGVVTHEGEKVSVTGYGVVRSDGTFGMRLEGEGLKLWAAGKARRWGRSYVVLMRGRMALNGEEYAFVMRGRAYTLRPFRPRPVPAPENEPTTPS